MTQSETVGCTVPGSNPEEASRETHKAHFRKDLHRIKVNSTRHVTQTDSEEIKMAAVVPFCLTYNLRQGRRRSVAFIICIWWIGSLRKNEGV